MNHLREAQSHYFFGDDGGFNVVLAPIQTHFAIENAIAETTNEWFRIYEPLKWD